jgi:hypothetical protein
MEDFVLYCQMDILAVVVILDLKELIVKKVNILFIDFA